MLWIIYLDIEIFIWIRKDKLTLFIPQHKNVLSSSAKLCCLRHHSKCICSHYWLIPYDYQSYQFTNFIFQLSASFLINVFSVYRIWPLWYTQKTFVRTLADSLALWENSLFYLDSKAKLALFRAFILSHFQYCSVVWYHCSKCLLCGKDSREGSKVCLFQPYRPIIYESLLNKTRLQSLEVGRQMNIAIQTFKIPNDLAPTYLLELTEKRCRTRN